MKYLILFSLCLLPISAFCSISGDGYLINSKIEYFNGKKTIKVEKDLILPTSNKNWTTLTDMKDGLILLGRRVPAETKGFRFEYIVLDTNKSPNGVVSLPVIVSPTDEAKNVNIEKAIGASGNIKLTLSASKTTFDLP
jgi:hypothetical protein